MAESGLLTMLRDAVNTLLAVLYGGAPERVECIVNTINENANARENLIGV